MYNVDLCTGGAAFSASHAEGGGGCSLIEVRSAL